MERKHADFNVLVKETQKGMLSPYYAKAAGKLIANATPGRFEDWARDYLADGLPNEDYKLAVLLERLCPCSVGAYIEHVVKLTGEPVTLNSSEDYEELLRKSVFSGILAVMGVLKKEFVSCYVWGRLAMQAKKCQLSDDDFAKVKHAGEEQIERLLRYDLPLEAPIITNLIN